MMETVPILWTVLALSYCLAGVYLRAFDEYDHPFWVWGSFIFTGSALFMLVNHQHFFNDFTSVSGAFEIATIIAAGVLGHTLFVAARERARALDETRTLRAERDDLQQDLKEYRTLIEHNDIDIEYNRELDDNDD